MSSALTVQQTNGKIKYRVPIKTFTPGLYSAIYSHMQQKLANDLLGKFYANTKSSPNIFSHHRQIGQETNRLNDNEITLLHIKNQSQSALSAIKRKPIMNYRPREFVCTCACLYSAYGYSTVHLSARSVSIHLTTLNTAYGSELTLTNAHQHLSA